MFLKIDTGNSVINGTLAVKKPCQVSDVFNHFNLGTYPATLNVYSDDYAGLVQAQWKITFEDLIQLCGGIPSQQITEMDLTITTVSIDALKVEIATEFYYVARTIDFNNGVISNDLMDVFDEDEFTGTTLFLFQVQYARKKGFHELRTQAQSREYDTGVAGKEWDGYYRWARVGYQMYDPAQLKRLNELLQQGKRSEKTLGELVLSLDNDEGYTFWKKAAVDFTWDGKFELKDNSVSMTHLRKYLVKKNIKNYTP